jgi:hypothetical protein
MASTNRQSEGQTSPCLKATKSPGTKSADCLHGDKSDLILGQGCYVETHLDFLPCTVTLNPGLGGQGVHQRLDGVTSVPLLNETNGRVDQEQQDDTDEILPIRGSALTVGKGDSDQSSSLHDPGEGVPHEGKELQEGVLGLLLELLKVCQEVSD